MRANRPPDIVWPGFRLVGDGFWAALLAEARRFRSRPSFPLRCSHHQGYSISALRSD